MLATGRRTPEKIPSGPLMTAKKMAALVRAAVAGWDYEAVSIGYPGPVRSGRPVTDPKNLGSGWVRFDFQKAFGRPVKVINEQRCRPSAATRVDACSSSVWGRALAPR